MKSFFRLFLVLLLTISIFACPAPTPDSTDSSVTEDVQIPPQAPQVTHEALMNTVYTGERTQFLDHEQIDEKYLHVEFVSKSVGGEVIGKLGRGKTAEEAKNNAQQNASAKAVSLKGLTVYLGHDLTIYMDEDLNQGITKIRKYVGNDIAHIKDATLIKQEIQSKE